MPINEYDELLKGEQANSAVNPYDQAAKDSVVDSKAGLQASMYVAAGKDPGRQAEVSNYAKQNNLPEDYVDRNYDTLKKKETPIKNYDSFVDKAPRTSEWLADPSNATLSKNDIDKLIDIEGGVDKFLKKDSNYFNQSTLKT